MTKIVEIPAAEKRNGQPNGQGNREDKGREKRKVPFGGLILVVVLLAAGGSGVGIWLACGRSAANPNSTVDAGAASLAGTWQLVIADGSVASTTTIVISGDGTFKQTVALQTGRTIEGTGTWTATDTAVSFQFTTCVERTNGAGDQPSTSCRSETKGYELTGDSLKVWDPQVGPAGGLTFTRAS